MSEALGASLMFGGAVFLLLAAIGIVRMPDLFMRMQASTKATTLGVGLLMLAVAFHFGELSVATRALAVIAFTLLTAPVAAHMIGRTAYFVGVPLCDRTICDELSGHYDMRTHELESVSLAGLGDHLPDVEIRLLRVTEASTMAQKTLAELELRKRFGVTVLAISRGSKTFSNPDVDMQIYPNDVLVVLGSPGSLIRMVSLLQGSVEEVRERA